MTTTTRQLSVHLTILDEWTPLVPIQGGSDYTVPVGARALARSIRLLNNGAAAVAVELAVSRSGSPSEAERIVTPTDVLSLEQVLVEGLVMIPASFGIFARLTEYAGYDSPSVTVQATVLEITS